MLLAVGGERPVDEGVGRAEVRRRLEVARLEVERFGERRGRSTPPRRQPRTRRGARAAPRGGTTLARTCASRVEVRPHPLGVDLEPLERAPRGRGGAAREGERAESAGHSACQRAGGALVLLRQRCEQRRRVRAAPAARRRARATRRPGCACAASSRTRRRRLGAPRRPRSGASSTTSSPIFASDAGGDGERGAELGDGTRFVCHGTTGSCEAELLGVAPQHLEAVVAERRERAGRAAELRRRAARAGCASGRVAPRAAPTSQPAAFSPNVVGTACWSSVRPAITVARCVVREPGALAPRRRRVARATSAERVARDEHRGGVEDVLARRAPVDVAGGVASDGVRERADERLDRVPGGAALRRASSPGRSVGVGTPPRSPPRPRLESRRRRASAAASARLGVEHRLRATRGRRPRRGAPPGRRARSNTSDAQRRRSRRSPWRRMSNSSPSSRRARSASTASSTADEDRVLCVRLLLVGEVHPRQHRLQQAAGEHQHSRCGAWPSTRPGLHVTNEKRPSSSQPERPHPKSAAIAPVLVGLPDLDHRVRHRLARAVEHAPADRTTPVRATSSFAAASQSPIEKNGPTVCDGRRAASVSIGVVGRPAEDDVELGSRAPTPARSSRGRSAQTSRSRAFGSRTDWKIGSYSNSGSPGKYICVTSRCVNARPKSEKWMCAGRHAFGVVAATGTRRA